MGLFDKIKEPIFLKETSNASEQIAQLQALLSTAAATLKPKIEQELKLLRAGLYGEEAIAFELRNSHIPMFILHDIYLECGDLSAQIDYLIVTRKRIFVLECKNLIGDIEINNNGDFIRTVQQGNRRIKEGIYSPVTQNRRHLELIRQLRRETKGNIIFQAIFDRNFYDNYRSIVVLSNPKTVLNARFAKKEIKQQVIRLDQLITYIQSVNDEPGAEKMSEQDMEELANFFLSLHREKIVDYAAKYQIAQEQKSPLETVKTESPARITCPRCGAPMVMRKVSKGPNAGKPFYGCSQFPKCRGIINIAQEL